MYYNFKKVIDKLKFFEDLNIFQFKINNLFKYYYVGI